ncbi:TlpA family protein disulfide reductase [Shewanella sp.]|uniref:TlpA family protein disulfide reductase n=1 Tax=Shewanella sp. TaxID=50422 RepID=UPI004047C7D1
MLKLNYNRIALLACLFVSNAALAQGETVAQVELKDLRSSRTTVSYHPNKPTILMFYQPGCKWCKKQGETMARLQKQCSDSIHFTLVGDKGTRSELKRELRHFSDVLPALQNTDVFARQSGGIIGFPTTLVIDNNGEILVNNRGMMKDTIINRLANQLTQGLCSP